VGLVCDGVAREGELLSFVISDRAGAVVEVLTKGIGQP
jgi:hypothetical protein